MKGGCQMSSEQWWDGLHRSLVTFTGLDGMANDDPPPMPKTHSVSPKSFLYIPVINGTWRVDLASFSAMRKEG
jgi:hypothetical protein